MPSDTSEPTGHTELRKLPCRLTQAEFNEKATEYALKDEQHDELEAERKASNEDFKDRIGGVNAERAKLRRMVMTRCEQRDVECAWFADFAGKSMILRRSDTGEAVEVRTMTPDEVQTHFDYAPKTDEPLDA